MTKVEGKLDEVHVDLWGPHHPASLSGKTYAAILLDAKTRKTWVIYLRSKDEFVDAFQVWLPKVENECNRSMKALRADGGGSSYLQSSETSAIRRAFQSNILHLTCTKKMDLQNKAEELL